MRITLFVLVVPFLLAACGNDVTSFKPRLVDPETPHRVDDDLSPIDIYCTPEERESRRCG